MQMNVDDFKLNILNYKYGNTDSYGTVSLYSIRRKTSGDSYRYIWRERISPSFLSIM